MIGTVCILLISATYAHVVMQRYSAARASADTFEERYAASNDQLPELGNLPQMTRDLRQLESDLASLQRLIDVPVLGRVAREVPIVGADIEASQRFLALGLELTDIAADATEIANRVRTASEVNGIRATDDSTGDTWLDIVRTSTPEIQDLEARFRAVVDDRNAIDEQSLPEGAQAMLPRLDELLAKAIGIRDEYFPLLPMLDVAFGANSVSNYVVLLQNREEIRPAGGFPGTFAFITISNGQLLSHDISDIRTLDQDYVEHRDGPITAPGPIRHVLGQKELLPHDSLWSPDFAESAVMFENMYREADWPELRGVVGMNDSVVRDLLTIIGPYQIDIDGRSYTVSADTYLDLIESHRDQTWADLAAHKHIVSQLGTSLLDRIIASDFQSKKAIYYALRNAADAREIQIHMFDPALQAEVERRTWDGALTPDPSTPTLATTIAGLTGGKKALTIHQRSRIQFEEDGAGIRVRWTITIDHQGDPSGNEVYNGYEYAWLSVYLPETARIESTSRIPAAPEVADDSRATSFGIAALPGTTHDTTIEFVVPATSQFMLRRQSGANDADVRIIGDIAGCSLDWTLTLSHDAIVNLDACTVAPAR